jgi:transposase
MKLEERFPFRVADLQRLSERLESGALEEADRALARQALGVLILILKRAEQTRISLRRLQKLLFGPRTEKGPRSSPGGSPGACSSAGEPAVGSPPAGPQPAGGAGPSNASSTEDQPGPEPPAPGPGRLAASAYTGAQVVALPHPDLKATGPCPGCGAGTLFPLQPGMDIRIVGHPPAAALRYERQRLRCSGCGQVYTAPLPAQAGPEKYDATVKATLATLKYGYGMPFHRLEQLQAQLGVPLPASTQWELVEQVADAARPVYHALQQRAARAEVLYADDSPVQILSLLQENRQQPELERRAVQTTVMVAEGEGPGVTLYESGRQHAGDNLAELLGRRPAGLSPPIPMTDALASNTAHPGEVWVSQCLAHARRKFYEIREFFPEVCGRVLQDLGTVYHQEAVARQQHLTPDERLAHHQRHSAPVLEELRQWLGQQLAQHQIEPNSSLGQAARYLLGHWEALTQFLRLPRAPLDNNPAEQALKTPILNRKNAYFYKTSCGALVGSLLMSLIRTCTQAAVNPIEYLVALQQQAAEVRKHPQRWLPWNWRDQLAPG